MSLVLRRHPQSPRSAALSKARHPRKERRTTLPSRLPAVLFPFKSLHVAGGEGGAWTSLSYILFPCARAGIYFFSFLYSLPLHPPLPPSFPSLPPSLLSRLGLCAGAPEPLRSRDARNSRQESDLPSLLPPFPFPAPFPHPGLGLGAAAKGTPR